MKRTFMRRRSQLKKEKAKLSSYDAAKKYLARGFSVIPLLPGSKKPAIPWQKYQTEYATEPDLHEWFVVNKYQIGIVTGKLSGICVVDLDSEQAIEFAKKLGIFDITPRVKTSKGFHLYFKYKPGLRNFQGRDDLPDIDLRGEGGYVVAPPSVHPSGHIYVYDEGGSLDDLPLAEFPEILIAKKPSEKRTISNILSLGSKKGSRNNDAARVAGHFSNEGLALDACINEMLAWNQKNTPPLPEEEIIVTVESIYARHQASGGRRQAAGTAAQIVQILTACSYYYFHDELDEAWVKFEIGGCHQVLSVGSAKFKSMIRKIGYENLGSPPKDAAVSEVVGVLAARAIFDGQMHALSYRSANTGDGHILVDLGNNKWEAARIGKDGWAVLGSQDVPTVFRRQSHMQPLPVPQPGGNIDDLKQLLHIPNPEIWILLKVWIVTAFVPDIPRPAVVFHGLHGAGKSVAAAILRALIDPSVTTLLPMPSGHDDFVQQLNNHYMICLDNLQFLKPWASDDICRAVTGGAFSKRKLYSDQDDIIFRFKRLIVINGISNPASASDLLDRSILVELDRVPESERRTERDLWAALDSMAPKVLGAAFDALSIALRTQQNHALPALPRMADWARLGYAVAEALGIGGEAFLEAYRNNTKLQHNEVIFTDPVADVIAKLSEANHELQGTPTEIYRRCSRILAEDEPMTKSWPKSVPSFARRLKMVSHNLRELGVHIEFCRGKNRLIIIKYKP